MSSETTCSTPPLESPSSTEITAQSGSNLALSFTCLPREKREAMSTFYAFCRIIDDIADSTELPLEQKRRELDAWHEEIRQAYLGKPQTPLGKELASIIQKYLIPPTPLEAIIHGVQMDLDKTRYETFAELEHYCYRVASAVGLVSIEIFTYQKEQTRDYAIALGMAFQLTNILRDIRKDASFGRIYLPQEELRRFDITEKEILEGQWSERMRQLCRFQHHRARHYFAKSWRLLCPEDRPNLLAAEIMREVYQGLLNQIRQREYDVFSQEVRCNKIQKAFHVWRAHQRERRALPCPPPPKNVLVLGAGLAGLTAATELTLRGHHVTLLEARELLGGRAHSFIEPKTGQVVDNSQHILMGCYHETLRLLQELGVSERLQHPATLEVPYQSDQGRSYLRAPRYLPAPFHLAVALWRFKELHFRDRWAATWLCLRLRLGHIPTSEETATTWFKRWHQPANLIRAVWEPFCLAALNEPLESASAHLLAIVIRRALLSGSRDAHILLSRVGLSELFAPEVQHLLHLCSNHLLTRQVITQLHFQENRLHSIQTHSGQSFQADHVVSALPWNVLRGLLPPESQLAHVCNHLEDAPIVSLHLWFDRPLLDVPFLGFLDSPLHWIFRHPHPEETEENYASHQPTHAPDFTNHPPLNQAYRYSFVISDARDIIHQKITEIEALTLRELHRFLPESQYAQVLHRVAYKSRSATFATTPAAQKIRPHPATEWSNFWLAGDWTQTHLPATLEGAVLSGVRAAQCVDSSS